MRIKTTLEIPSCPQCTEWMRPALCVEYPLPGAVWLCPNVCGAVWSPAFNPGELDLGTQEKLVFAALAFMIEEGLRH